MKKIILTIALAVFATTAWAEEQSPRKPSCAGFVSNGFWDNWDISIGGGVTINTTNGNDLGKLDDRYGFNGQLSVTKWVHPVLGLRMELQGGQFATIDPMQGKQKWPYVFAHPDIMLNLSNWIGGYRADRVYSIIPHFGFGYMAANFTDSSKDANNAGRKHYFAFGYGLLNKFRLSKAFDFDIELKGLLIPSQIAPTELNGNYFFGFSASVGFTYRFNKRGWQRGVAGYTAKDIKAFQDAVAQGQADLDEAQTENGRMSGALTAAQAQTAAAKAAAAKAEKRADEKISEARKKMLAAGSVSWVILYGIDEWELSSREKTRLDIVIERIKSGPKDKVYMIEGHADSQTGSDAANQRISEKRAKNVYNYLVNKGVSPSQLKYHGMGAAHNPYRSSRANRVVVIK